MKTVAMQVFLRLFCLGVMVIPLYCSGPAWAQGRGELLAVAPDSPERIEALGRDVERAESLRQVKDLQIVYTQYAQFGMWDEIGGTPRRSMWNCGQTTRWRSRAVRLSSST